MGDKKIEQKQLENLDNVIEIQCSNGNWNYDPYMQGMANGLLLAKHIVLGMEGTPPYKDAPKKWLKDYPSLWTKIKWKLFGVPMGTSPSEGSNELINNSIPPSKEGDI